MFTLELAFEKATKNKVRFEHPDFGTVYVPNAVFTALGAPEKIVLTLEAAAPALAVAA